MLIVEHDAITGETIEREPNEQELAQHVEDQAAAEAAAQAAAAKEAADAAARDAAIAHAKSLGFTDEMIAVMYPNLAVAADPETV